MITKLKLPEETRVALDQALACLTRQYSIAVLEAPAMTLARSECDCGGGCKGSCTGSCGGCGGNCKGSLELCSLLL
jgi:hypothetical protein